VIVARRTLFIASGLIAGLVAGWWVAGRAGGGDLTRPALEQAHERWRREGPLSYVLVIETRGEAGKRHVVEVRDGRVVGMESGGRPAARTAWSYWSVDGLFGFLETELANADAARQTYGVASEQVVLKAHFDGRLGYPSRFLRHVLGTANSIEWEVESLTASAVVPSGVR
jgi:hypothetical protein